MAIWILGAGAAIASLALASRRPPSPWAGLVLLIPVLLVAWALLQFWRAQRPRLLSWDGEQWFLMKAGQTQDAEPLATVEVCLDLQRALLLRGRGAGRDSGVWLWAQAHADPIGWHGLRCALCSGAVSSVRDRDSTLPGRA